MAKSRKGNCLLRKDSKGEIKKRTIYKKIDKSVASNTGKQVKNGNG